MLTLDLEMLQACFLVTSDIPRLTDRDVQTALRLLAGHTPTASPMRMIGGRNCSWHPRRGAIFDPHQSLSLRNSSPTYSLSSRSYTVVDGEGWPTI